MRHHMEKYNQDVFSNHIFVLKMLEISSVNIILEILH